MYLYDYEFRHTINLKFIQVQGELRRLLIDLHSISMNLFALVN